MDTSCSAQVNKTYHRLNEAHFNYRAEGARMTVYDSPDLPRVVLKIMATPEHLAAKFAGWGIPLDKQDWAPVKGNALASAQKMLDDSRQSFQRAFLHLNGLAAPFMVLDGTASATPEGIFKLSGPDSKDVERNFKGAIAVVQEKVRVFEEFIPSSLSPAEEKDYFSVFQGFVDLTLNLWRRGLFFEVLNFHNDYGIDRAGKVMVSDLGELTDRKEKALSYVVDRKMFNEHAYRAWLNVKYPGLTEFYRTIVDRELTADKLKAVWRIEAGRSGNQVVFDDNLLLGS